MKHLKTFESYSSVESQVQVQAEAEEAVSKLNQADLETLASMSEDDIEMAATEMAEEIVQSQKESVRYRRTNESTEMTPEEKNKSTQRVKKYLFALGFTVAGAAALSPFIIAATGGVLTFAAVKAAIIAFLGGATTAAGVVASEVVKK